MQRSAFESFHPWVIFGYLAAVLAVTMSTMHPVMIVTSFVISLVYSLFLCGRVVWKRSVMTGQKLKKELYTIIADHSFLMISSTK